MNRMMSNMRNITLPEEMRAASTAVQRAGKRVALVPTMGFLHEGHLSLVDLARAEADCVIVSIFVNPTQFGPGEDFERYPRDAERDEQLCRSRGVDIVFCPKAEAVYFPDHTVFVEENVISKSLCGASRPGHFRGVLTVVAKLFNIVHPDISVFGQKDAQQARLIERMVRDLNFPTRILLGPIVREPDGLAMSSRNAYLSDAERNDALCLVDALKLARDMYLAGERLADRIKDRVTEYINRKESAVIDYVEIVDYNNYEVVTRIDEQVIILIAVRIGGTRLIDNLILPENPLCNLPA